MGHPSLEGIRQVAKDKADQIFTNKLESGKFSSMAIADANGNELQLKLDEINDAIVNPEQFGKVRINWNNGNWDFSVAEGEEASFEYLITDLLQARKAFILKRIRRLNIESRIRSVQDLLDTVEDDNLRMRLEKERNDIESRIIKSADDARLADMSQLKDDYDQQLNNAIIFVPQNMSLVSIEELIGAVRDEGIRKRFERDFTDLKSQVGLEVERVKAEVTKRLQGQHEQMIKDIEAKKDSEIHDLGSKIMQVADQTRLDVEGQLQTEHKQALIDNTAATEKKKDDEFKDERTRLQSHLRWVLGGFFVLIGVCVVLLQPQLYRLDWFEQHANRDAIRLTLIVLIVTLGWSIADRPRWKIALGSSFGVFLVLLALLGRLGAVTS